MSDFQKNTLLPSLLAVNQSLVWVYDEAPPYQSSSSSRSVRVSDASDVNSALNMCMKIPLYSALVCSRSKVLVPVSAVKVSV